MAHPLTPDRLDALDTFFESRAGTEAGIAGAALVAEVRRCWAELTELRRAQTHHDSGIAALLR